MKHNLLYLFVIELCIVSHAFSQTETCGRHPISFHVYRFNSVGIESFLLDFIAQEKNMSYFREDLTYECSLYEDSCVIVLEVASGFFHTTGVGHLEDDYGVALVGLDVIFLNASNWDNYVEPLLRDTILPVYAEKMEMSDTVQYLGCEVESEYQNVRYAKLLQVDHR